MRISRLLSTATLSGLLFTAHPAAGQDHDPVPEIGLEDLVNTEVISASRRTQSIQRVAAAVFVITQEDISRSGARSLADVLSMAPGMEVAHSGNNRWAVTARGNNGRFANKLQVLKDGRSIYSPLFSGVFWEAEDMVLEDIERIEIIRGPNAAMWGSNAVNGTINIITRKARDTQGNLIAFTTGTEDRLNLTARHGTALPNGGHLRLYGKAVDRFAGLRPADGNRATDWSNDGLAGFRADWLLSSGNRLMLTGEAYRNHNADTYNFPDPTKANGVGIVNSVMALSGAHLHGRFESLADDGSELTFQSYLTQRTLEAQHVLHENRNTLDLDLQYRLPPRNDHDLMVGINYRLSADQVSNPPGSYVTFASPSRNFRLLGVFINDEITLQPNKLSLTLGARLENNNYAGTNLQPTARILWTPTAQQSIWGALSRATRTPSRAEGAASMPLSISTSGGIKVLTAYRNSTESTQEAEKMDALELGYRHRYHQNLSFDATIFSHRYRDGITGYGLAQDMSTIGSGYIVQPMVSRNNEHSRVYGIEFSSFIQVSHDWRLQPAYTWMMGRAATDTPNAISDASARKFRERIPRQQISLRSQHELRNGDQLDFWFKYKTRIPDLGIPSRGNLDIRYAWKVDPAIELSIVGQNLLHRSALEYLPNALPSATVEIGRSLHLHAKYRF